MRAFRWAEKLAHIDKSPVRYVEKPKAERGDSPAKMIEKAKSLFDVDLGSQSRQQKVRKVAESYVQVAEENQRRFDEFERIYRGHLPPTSM
jgi:hypothetical protein